VTLFGWGKKPPLTPAQQLQSGRWRCAKCSEEHGWPVDLAAHAPDPWRGDGEYKHNGALRYDGDFLSEDFCVLDGKYFMVRAVLRIPVKDVADDFGFGCWSTLSRENFDIYVHGFDNGEYPDWGPWSGWLCNQLADYVGDDPLAVWVEPRPERKRPLLWVMDDDHPLAIAQEKGITAERVLELFAYYCSNPETC